MATSKEKIVITGSGGVLGSAICNRLDSRYEIVALTHNDCDITDKGQIEKRIKNHNPGVLINTAALTNVDECERNPSKAKNVNVDGVENLALACKELDCLMVHVSTDYVFDGENNSAYSEDDKPDPISVYAQTKLDGEDIVKNTLKKFFIIRPSWLFGKKDKDFVDTVVRRIEEKTPLKIVNNKFSIPTYNLDLAKAIDDLISKVDDYGIYNITNSGGCSWYDFAKEIAKLYLGKDVEIEPISMEDLGLSAKRPKNSVLDNEKFYRALGYRLRPWQEALKEYMDICHRN